LILLLALFQILTSSGDTGKYPRWFFFPPDSLPCITGYSYQTTTPNYDASVRWSVFTSAGLTGNVEYWNHQSKNPDDRRNSDYQFEFSSPLADSIQPKLVSIDRFGTNQFQNEYIELYSFSPDTAGIFDWQKLTTYPKQSWTDSTAWHDEDFFYGVGSFTIKYNENDAWRVAEDRAILAAVQHYQLELAEVKILNRSEMKDDLEGVTRLRFNHRLTGITVLGRWVNTQYKTALVWVRVKKIENLK